MLNIIKIIRPHQYIKNLFVFAPMFFSFSFTSSNFFNVFTVFVLFSLLASSIYVFNDLMDIEEDKQHPNKRFRPLANGKIKTSAAKIIIFIFASIPLGISFIINLKLFFILISYLLVNIAYSLKLKHIAIVDIFIIGIGFIMRLFAGTSVILVPLSMWIIIMTFLLSLFLAIAKRRDDVLLSTQGKETRKNIHGYNLEFANALLVFMAGVIVVSYILYTVSPDVIARLQTHHLYLTAFFVILGITKYMQITFVEEDSGSPTKIFLKNRFLQITILSWLISFFLIVKI